MVRGVSTILAVGLTVLWLVGLGDHATIWLSWLDALAALCGFAIALGPSDIPRRRRAAGPLALGIGLAIVWMVAISTGARPWLTWWTFAFACAYLAIGIGAALVGRRPTPATPHPA
jgi:hypothetical protein